MENDDFKEFLENSIVTRDRELFMYDIEINKFKFSIDNIETEYADNVDMIEYKKKLLEDLKMIENEKIKTLIHKNALKRQLEDLLNQQNT
jgi:hypothetical protein